MYKCFRTYNIFYITVYYFFNDYYCCMTDSFVVLALAVISTDAKELHDFGNDFRKKMVVKRLAFFYSNTFTDIFFLP